MATLKGGKVFVQRIKAMTKDLAGPRTLRVGFLEGATYPDGTSVPMVAAIQEFGAPRARIPPRPFFRNMIRAKRREWGPAIAALLKDNPVDAALAIAGNAIVGQLKQSIVDTNSPALSPVTLMLRKMKGQNPDLVVTRRTVGIAARRVAAGESTAGVSTKPLIWMNRMRNAVDYEIVKR